MKAQTIQNWVDIAEQLAAWVAKFVADRDSENANDMLRLRAQRVLDRFDAAYDEYKEHINGR